MNASGKPSKKSGQLLIPVPEKSRETVGGVQEATVPGSLNMGEI